MLPGRRSIAFFCNPNYDAVIECIPGCEGPMGASYEPINFGDYITGRCVAVICGSSLLSDVFTEGTLTLYANRLAATYK